jgi:hypothetical protein
MHILANAPWPGRSESTPAILATPSARFHLKGNHGFFRDDAAKAWLTAQRLPGPSAAADWIPDRDLLQWPTPVQHIYVLVDLINQVRSNGFSGWCGNGYAKRYSLTIDACRAVGATTCAALVEQAIAVFGPLDGLSPTQITDRLTGPQDDAIQDVLHAPSATFWRDPDHLQCLMADYIAKHRQLFSVLKPI